MKSQRDQIGEQRTFIGEQRAFMAEQSATLALERQELHAVAEDRKWAQAQQLHMHFHGAGTPRNGVVTEDDQWVVTVLNTSDAPVHGVDVRFGTAHLAAEVYEIAPTAVHNGGASLGDRVVAPVDVLGPRRAVRFFSPRWSSSTVHNNRPTVTFADNNGIRWSLNSHGKLEEVPGGSP
ncbi:hypothetical protein DMH26_17635 [Streptomyces sp. WAC 05379]|nr:hypothetical protein DMH26_17635 [Streptomyces sp. WAC 05379]